MKNAITTFICLFLAGTALAKKPRDPQSIFAESCQLVAVVNQYQESYDLCAADAFGKSQGLCDPIKTDLNANRKHLRLNKGEYKKLTGQDMDLSPCS